MEHGPTFRWMKPGTRLPEIGVDKPDELIDDLSFAEYLADSSCISSSGVRKILKSPQHFIADVMGFLKDDDEDAEKDCYRFGRAAHMMVLEPAKFRALHIVEPEFTGFTKDGRESTQSKEAKDKKAKWYGDVHPDAIVLTQKEIDDLSYMVDSLMAHEQASNLLKNGKAEVSGRFTHPETKVRCRIRPDYLTYDNQNCLYISDLKTTKDAGPGLFANDIAKFKYHVQLAFYADGVAQITGKQVEQVAIIAMEKSKPYSVAVYWINEDDLEVGRRWYQFALRTYVSCVERNEWPSLQGQGQMINLPRWTETEPFPSFDWKG